MEKLRIQNLEFREASYLGEKPKHPSWNIYKWEPNGYYGNEHLYIKDGDYYKYKEPEYGNCRIHKNCFKNKETRYSIASFYWDDHEECFNFEFTENRPLSLTPKEKAVFWQLIEYGFKVLNEEKCSDF